LDQAHDIRSCDPESLFAIPYWLILSGVGTIFGVEKLDRADLAILISALSFIVACAALGWNIFRELWLRPRLRVSLDIVELMSEVMLPTRKMMIAGTNFGAGKIRVSMVWFRKGSLLQRLRHKARQGVLIYDYKNPLSGKLPITLDVGERVELIFPFENGGLLAERPTDVGLRDNFGRDHWVPRKTLQQAQAEYDQAFGAQSDSKKS
jgi:hypothetical protein